MKVLVLLTPTGLIIGLIYGEKTKITGAYFTKEELIENKMCKCQLKV